jgi:hypothetical protein
MFLLSGRANLTALLERAKSAGLQHVVLLVERIGRAGGFGQ